MRELKETFHLAEREVCSSALLGEVLCFVPSISECTEGPGLRQAGPHKTKVQWCMVRGCR